MPELAERQALQPGCYVKLAFAPTDGRGPTERMWVQVTAAADSRGVLTGTLANDPLNAHLGLQAGQRVEFEARHVLGRDHD
jgi:hypothetical protein